MEDLIAKVQDYIETYQLLPATRLVVGCSGGADSMALLFVLQKIVTERYPDTEILVAHVHHGIREEADVDEELVRDFCAKLNLPFHSEHISVPEMAKEEKMSLESAGRKARYAYFASLCGADGRIAVAHHMEDQAESVAMHIFRGSGMEGLLGMQPRNGQIIRPFLGVHKAEILAFCAQNQIPYVRDLTNEDSSYDRNFWRNELFPAIANGTNRDPVTALTQLSSRISEENDYLDTLAEAELAKILQEDGSVLASDLPQIPGPLLRRVLRHLAMASFGDVVDLESTHWEMIRDFVLTEGKDGYLCLPGQRLALLEQGRFTFLSAQEAFAPDQSGMVSGIGYLVSEDEMNRCVELDTLPMNEFINYSQRFPQIRLRSIEKDCRLVYNDSTWFFPHFCLEGAVLRTRREGDRFKRAGSSCSKELRRYMNELQIPARFRDRVLLVAQGNDVLWIPGFAHAVGFTDENSRNKCEPTSDEMWYELALTDDEDHRTSSIS